ncbi:MAG: chorismate mutase [Pseudomonadota bacterium]
MTKAAQECANMDEVRVEIDRLDKAIVELIAERWTYVDRAWQLKSSPSEATVPWRIQQVIDKVRDHAEAHDLPPALAEALWRQIIGWGIQYEEEKLSDKS